MTMAPRAVMTMAPRTARPRPVQPVVQAPTQAPATNTLEALVTVSRSHFACKPIGSRCTSKAECCGLNVLCRGFPVRTCS
jgi:hypothetical protein